MGKKQLLTLQCRGSGLPSTVESIPYLGIEREMDKADLDPEVIASVSFRGAVSIDYVTINNISYYNRYTQ